ncbi:FecR domain-containing protein [Tamlana sp. 62-3]|uniref:FecR domain-containing protein n=1 Tax=Neotamlana sargassicola TaxID=2883125 RepID=A0A9X1I5S4_9FLAO|nr:FecR domain-containing protein [Tamlana sargassicola]MCB4807838.1 FecR domain-containing protein [Tamlana sargassicola]
MQEFPPHIFKLVTSYINNSISNREFDELTKWINHSPENRQLFKDYLYLYKKSRSLKFAESLDTDKAWSKTIEKLQTPNALKIEQETKHKITKSGFKFLQILKYASILVVFITTGFYVYNNNFSSQPDTVKELNQITLQLENGDIQVLTDVKDEHLLNSKGEIVGEQKGNKLTYSKIKNQQELIYNTLTIPYGKHFEISLSDGTKVYLNAGSSLKYPVNFINGSERKVFLTGEAYFDVEKDAKHPFIVNSGEMNVRVLGTEFNLSSYPEDKNIKTVLVEGAVSVYNAEDAYTSSSSTKLSPGFKASFNKGSKTVSVKKADLDMETAWVKGRIIFRKTLFSDIIKKLERQYNVSIENNNLEIGNQRFAASFDNETIEEVLESFNTNFNIDYTIKENKIIIH